MGRYTGERALVNLGVGAAALTLLVLVLWPMAAGGQAAPAWLVGTLVPAVPIVSLLGGLGVVRTALRRRARRAADLGTAELLHARAKAQAAEEKLAGFEERGAFVTTFGLGVGVVGILLMLPGHLNQGLEQFLTSGAVWTLLAGAMLMLAMVGLATGGMWAFHAVRYHWWQVTLDQSAPD